MRIALVCVVGLVGCTAELPGEIVGTYRITMKLSENTCGPVAVYTSDGEEYSAQLRADKDKGYWRIADGKPLPGEYSSEGRFRFLFSSIVASSDPDAGTPGCQLVQAEELAGQIIRAQSELMGDAGAADGGQVTTSSGDGDTTLAGTHTLNISGVAGSDCSGALTSAGGGFEKLPCVVKYTLSGIERDDF